MKNARPWVAVLPAMALLVAGCGGPRATDEGKGSGGEAITVKSCGREVTFESAPKRVLAVGSEAPSMLVAAGVGDKITHYAGTYEVPFRPETKKVVKDAERVTEDSHELSFDMIVNSGVDTVIGTDITAGVDLDSLADRLEKAGVKMLTVSGYCAGIDDGRKAAEETGYDLIYHDIETYGRLFGTEKKAAKSIKELKGRVAAASKKMHKKADRTAVPLYVPTKGSYGSYGSESLVSEQMKLLGLENIFSDVKKRYFEPSRESLVDKDPDLIFGIYLPTGSSTLETDEDVVKQVRGSSELKGLEAIKKDDTVVPLNYYYTSPGPLAVDGLEVLAERLSKQ